MTVAENAADADGDGTGTGGGIFVNDDNDAYLEMHNTLVAENHRGTGTLADQIVGTVDSVSSHNLAVGSGAARLGPLGDNGGPTLTHALLGGSIAIDAGDNDKVPAGVLTDQRGDGFSRIVGSRVDIGAFEAIADPQTFIVGANTDIVDRDYSAGQLSLREAINLANDNVGADTIVFDLPLNSAIDLTMGGVLDILDDVAIQGPADSQLKVGVFSTGAAAFSGIHVGNNLVHPTVAISDITFAAPARSPIIWIDNRGDLNLDRVIINDAGTTGLRNLETVDIRNSTIAENKTGIVNAGVLHAWDSTISRQYPAGNRKLRHDGTDRRHDL